MTQSYLLKENKHLVPAFWNIFCQEQIVHSNGLAFVFTSFVALLFTETTHQDSVPSMPHCLLRLPHRGSVNEWNYEFQALLFISFSFINMCLFRILCSACLAGQSLHRVYGIVRGRKPVLPIYSCYMDFKYLCYTLGYIPIRILLLRLFQCYLIGALSIVSLAPLHTSILVIIFPCSFSWKGLEAMAHQ